MNTTFIPPRRHCRSSFQKGVGDKRTDDYKNAAQCYGRIDFRLVHDSKAHPQEREDNQTNIIKFHSTHDRTKGEIRFCRILSKKDEKCNATIKPIIKQNESQPLQSTT